MEWTKAQQKTCRPAKIPVPGPGYRGFGCFGSMNMEPQHKDPDPELSQYLYLQPSRPDNGTGVSCQFRVRLLGVRDNYSAL
jgi:hypothetical protein